jgi:predicted aspartyl protease
MINTIRYGGHQEVEKDGKKLIIPVSSPIILNQMGAIIEATITHPLNVQEKMKLDGREIPMRTVRAMIDTGASSSVITPEVANALGLVHTGYQRVSSVQDEQQRPIYFGMITFSWGAGKEIPLISCPLKHFDCLIGRDILQHWHFTYNGPDGSITVCD